MTDAAEAAASVQYLTVISVLFLIHGSLMIFRNTIQGMGFGISALGSAAGRTGKVIAAILCAVIGGFLGSNPLILAAWFGRIIGIVLVLDGLQDIVNNHRQGRRFVMPLMVSVVGALLILLPMSVSRLIFSGLGVVVLILGISMLLDRIRGRNRLNPPDDPNIIDAL